MSEWIFEFRIVCPFCGEVANMADGYETDDWAEVFVFSGYSQKSANAFLPYDSRYTCPACRKSIERDELYRGGHITDDSIDRVKAYFVRMYDHVAKRGRIYDHGWSPDLSTVLLRYSLLHPEDEELTAIRQKYLSILG